MKTINQYVPDSVSHPGTTLAEKLEELGMGPKEFAIRTSKPEKTITAILKGESSITPEMSVQFEKVLGIPAKFWLQRQLNYEEAVARLKRKEKLKQAEEWVDTFPYASMVKLGWIPKVTKKEERVEVMLGFFAISDHKSWNHFYYESQLKTRFRISLAHTKAPQAISAWLRQGDILASRINSATYSKSKFEKALPKVKSIMAAQPKDFFKQLQEICLEAGVKVVPTPTLPKAPISGSTRWLGDTPLIQLSGRYKRNDAFWFTFFHEAGHIILHGKKDIFLEKVDYDDKDEKKEKEADEFAAEWVFSKQEEEEVSKYPTLNAELVTKIAKKIKTHPAIIIGRFQHKGLIPYSLGRELFVSIDLTNS